MVEICQIPMVTETLMVEVGLNIRLKNG